MRRPAMIIGAATLPLFACADMDPSAPAVDPIQTLSTAPVLDGLHNGGNPHFFFLPPLVKNPRANGTFNPDLLPVVEICALADGSVCADPQPSGFPLRFTMAGSGPAAVRLNEADGHYSFNLQTGRYPLDPDVDYRIRVFPVLGGAELGHIDVDLIASGAAGRGTQASSDLVSVQQGSTLPVRFRIEQGIACSDTDDCAEAVVGSEGFTVVTPSDFAGVEIPPGALDAPVLISVERVDVAVEPCLPNDLIQAEGCYRYDTDPELSEVQESGLNEFNTDVLIGICIDPEVLALPEHHQYALHKFDPEQPELGIVQLPSAPVDYLNCDGFRALALAESSGFMRLARAGWQRLAPFARLLGPARAHAVNLGFGGLSKSFSNIGWARGLALEVLAGDGQSGAAGSTLPVDPAVRVTATHWDPETFETAPVVEGIEVTFTFTHPNGAETVLLDTTDTGGMASVPWVLGEGVGVNTLSVRGATLVPVALHATAVIDPLVLESITAGGSFVCGLDEEGFAYCWGANGFGQLGSGTTEPSLTPVQVGGADSEIRFQMLSAGEWHACGISTADIAYCWGHNRYGMLGTGGTIDQHLPQPIPGLRFTTISAGLTSTCAVAEGGEAYCWGADDSGQLGGSTEEDCGGVTCSTTPSRAADPLIFREISAGVFHTCAIDLSGLGYCWGSNSAGQLGALTEDVASIDPVLVAGDLTFRSIAAGGFDTCGVTTDGGAYCWGSNDFGQLGNGTREGGSEPSQVQSSMPFTHIELQRHNNILQHACALSESNLLLCWGTNEEGQLGVGSTALDRCEFLVSRDVSCSDVPLEVSGTWQSFALGRQFACALDTEQTLFCWGRNDAGQFGDGTTESTSVPKRVILARP